MTQLFVEKYKVCVKDNYDPKQRRIFTKYGNTASEVHAQVIRDINLNREDVEWIKDGENTVVFDLEKGFQD